MFNTVQQIRVQVYVVSIKVISKKSKKYAPNLLSLVEHLEERLKQDYN